MRLHLARLWAGLVRSLSASSSSPLPARRTLLRAEPLEDRLAPAVTTPCCPYYVAGAPLSTGSDSADFVTGTKWDQPNGPGTTVTLTYSYSNLLDGGLGGGLSSTAIRAAIQEALSRWAAVAPLRFIEVPDSGPAPSTAEYDPTGKPMLRFGRRAIDGPNGVLAYGYFPGDSGLAGDVQLDTAEQWAVNPLAGKDLIEVATHEIGHALGLEHQPGPAAPGVPAIMNPVYGSRFHGLGTSFLYADDINAIRSLYGTGQGSVAPLGSGGNPTPPPPVATAFRLTGTTLTVLGTTGNDVLVINGATNVVEINGEKYTGNLTAIRTIQFNGLGGDDQAQLAGTVAAETFDLGAGLVRVTGPIRNITLWNVETVDASGGTGDVLVLRDSAGDDTFTGGPNTGQMQAGIYDLSGHGFAHVVAVASRGTDEAWLRDSAGNDTFWATAATAKITGTGYAVTATGFEAVNTRASTGQDIAYLQGSAGRDSFTTSTYAQMTSQGKLVLALGFANVQIDGGAGADVAYLYDSPGDDTFVGTATSSVMYGAGYRVVAYGCEAVYAYGSGGADQARVYASGATDRFTVNAVAGTMAYRAVFIQFVGFEQAEANGAPGVRSRRLIVSPATYQISWLGLWG